MNPVSANLQVVFRIAAQELDVFGCAGDHILDQATRKTQAVVLIHETSARQRTLFHQRYGVTHTDMFKHIQNGVVNLFFFRLVERPVAATGQTRLDG